MNADGRHIRLLIGLGVAALLLLGRIFSLQILNNRYFTSHLDQALAENWISVWYQPIIRAESGRICDEEALSRWFDPEKGMMSPTDFIPVLEKARLMMKITAT